MSHQLTVQNNRPLTLTPSSFAEAISFAEMMSKANLLPQHLRGSPSDCMAVVLQAARWEMDPFAVAQKTSVIGGKLMYEGQLVAAVINSRGDLEEELDYQFAGDGSSRVVKVLGQKMGWKTPRFIDLTYKQACEINKNGQMQKNPDQQMCYIGARIWGRRYMPHLMLGVYAPEEMSTDVESTEVSEAAPPPVRVAPPPKVKGVSAVRDLKNVTPQKETLEPVAETVPPPAPPSDSIDPTEDDTPPPPNAALVPKFQFVSIVEFEVKGRKFFDIQIVAEDGNASKVYWAGAEDALPEVGSYARLKFEEKKSSKEGGLPKTFITEIHPE